MDKSKIEELAMQIEGIAGAFRLMSGSTIIEDYESKMFHFFCHELSDISKQLVECCYSESDN